MPSANGNQTPNGGAHEQDVERNGNGQHHDDQRVSFRTRLAVIVENFSFLW